jgi:hypothetical protein
VFVLYVRFSIVLVFLSIYIIYILNFVHSICWFNVQHLFKFNVFLLCFFVCLNQNFDKGIISYSEVIGSDKVLTENTKWLRSAQGRTSHRTMQHWSHDRHDWQNVKKRGLLKTFWKLFELFVWMVADVFCSQSNSGSAGGGSWTRDIRSSSPTTLPLFQLLHMHFQWDQNYHKLEKTNFVKEENIHTRNLCDFPTPIL